MIITNFNNLMMSTFRTHISPLICFLGRLGWKVKPCYTSITSDLSSKKLIFGAKSPFDILQITKNYPNLPNIQKIVDIWFLSGTIRAIRK